MTKTKKIIFGIGLLFLVFQLYKFSPYKIEFIGYHNKIWAHRVNSKEKLNSALLFYNGVELDLEYFENKNVLDVNHPPKKSINLNFENYFSEINTDQEPYLWLDLKNLNKENAGLILNRLLEVLGKRNYPLNKVLIETRYPEALPIFTEKGFLTSYYLPSGLYYKSNNEKELAIKKIKEHLSKQPKIGISSNYYDYQIMKDNFPERDKYLWMINSVKERWFTKSRTVLKDEKVKVVLVRYKAISGNR